MSVGTGLSVTRVQDYVREDRDVNIFIELGRMIAEAEDHGRFFQTLTALRTMASGAQVEIQLQVRLKNE